MKNKHLPQNFSTLSKKFPLYSKKTISTDIAMITQQDLIHQKSFPKGVKIFDNMNV